MAVLWDGVRTAVSSAVPTARPDDGSGPPDDKGSLTFSIAGLRHAAVRKRLSDGVLSGGSGQGRLPLLEAPAEQGDPENALASLTFGTERIVNQGHRLQLRVGSDRCDSQPLPAMASPR